MVLCPFWLFGQTLWAAVVWKTALRWVLFLQESNSMIQTDRIPLFLSLTPFFFCCLVFYNKHNVWQSQKLITWLCGRILSSYRDAWHVSHKILFHTSRNGKIHICHKRESGLFLSCSVQHRINYANRPSETICCWVYAIDSVLNDWCSHLFVMFPHFLLYKQFFFSFLFHLVWIPTYCLEQNN